jgi:hypothetical protein
VSSLLKFAADSDFSFKEIHVNDLTGEVMAGAGGAAGSAREICHQPPGKTI